MAQRTLGLDVGTRSVKAVVVEGAYRGYTVLATARADVEQASGPEAPPLRERQAAAVKRLLAEAHLAFDSAVVALPGAPASQVITLPFVDPRRIDQTVGFEVESQIPFDLAEVVWDWQPLGTREGKTELLVSVVRKEEMGGLLAALAGAGVDPRVAAPPAPSYAPLFAAGAVAATPVRFVPAEGEPPPSDAPVAPAVAEAPGAEALLDVG
ncbi:MAG: pilus assembly protein PilM, partial [Anaeromyxobacteraceae bacterium]